MYVARDEDGRLFLYEKMPDKIYIQGKGFSWYRGGASMCINENLFPSLLFKDGALEVELVEKQKQQ